MAMESERLRACTSFVMARIASGARVPYEEAVAHLYPPETVQGWRDRRAAEDAAVRQARELDAIIAFNEAFYGGDD